MRTAFLFLFGFLSVSCHGSDSMFTELVGTYLKGGPAAACCISYGGGAASPDCAKDAEIKCAFARDATLTFRVEPGSDANDALVYVDLAGANGHGTCTFRVNDLGTSRQSTTSRGRGIRIQSGVCKPAP